MASKKEAFFQVSLQCLGVIFQFHLQCLGVVCKSHLHGWEASFTGSCSPGHVTVHEWVQFLKDKLFEFDEHVVLIVLII